MWSSKPQSFLDVIIALLLLLLVLLLMNTPLINRLNLKKCTLYFSHYKILCERPRRQLE